MSMATMKYRCSSVAVVLFLMVACANAALRVKNDLEHGDITLVRLPGCCNYCTGDFCPQVCAPCNPVVVANGKKVTLETNVGPYPLDSLRVQLEGSGGRGGDIYCAAENDLLHLTTTALLQIGPGTGCDSDFPSISARIVDKAVEGPTDSGRFEICLILCVSSRQSVG